MNAKTSALSDPIQAPSGGEELKPVEPPHGCSCHPDDNPPRPCPRKHALADCRAAAKPALSAKAGEAVAELEDFSRWLARNGMSQGRLVDRTIALIQDQAAEIDDLRSMLDAERARADAAEGCLSQADIAVAAAEDRAETAEAQIKALSGGGFSSLRHQEDGCAPGIEPEQTIETGEGLVKHLTPPRSGKAVSIPRAPPTPREPIKGGFLPFPWDKRR